MIEFDNAITNFLFSHKGFLLPVHFQFLYKTDNYSFYGRNNIDFIYSLFIHLLFLYLCIYSFLIQFMINLVLSKFTIHHGRIELSLLKGTDTPSM
jgi:hypothetical protein